MKGGQESGNVTGRLPGKPFIEIPEIVKIIDILAPDNF